MPNKCDKCGSGLQGKKYVDGRHPAIGSWGNFCTPCFKTIGGKFGTGLGQLFTPDGKKVKG